MGALIAMLAAALLCGSAAAQTKFPDRPYEAVILYGSSLSALHGVPVEQVRMFTYDASADQWREIPAQVDEVGPDAFFGGDDGMLDGQAGQEDEVVFMLRDAGDRAPTDAWPTEADVETPRIEVELSDGDGHVGYTYIYRVRSPGPRPDGYGMAYDPAADRVSSQYYQVGFDSTIAIKEVRILPAQGGDGQDLVDTQKMRFKFRPPLARPFEINEQLDFRTEAIDAVVGPVRVIRRVTARMPSLSMTFHFTARFYPYSMVAGGGKRAFSSSLNISLLRQSLDLNEHAVGMRFVNPRNSGILIDGNPDNPDRSLDVPGFNWFLVTGSQGSIFSVLDVPPLGDAQALYYRDDASGGTADGTQDTGDGKSYGDVGVMITGTKISGEYDFSNMRLVLLPPNQTAEDAEKLFHQLTHPVARSVRTQQFTAVAGEEGASQPRGFQLFAPNPNPFRSAIRIEGFLSHPAELRLEVVDVRGRTVRTLLHGRAAPGRFVRRWHGRTDAGVVAPSGVYFVRLVVEGKTARIRKILLVR